MLDGKRTGPLIGEHPPRYCLLRWAASVVDIVDKAMNISSLSVVGHYHLYVKSSLVYCVFLINSSTASLEIWRASTIDPARSRLHFICVIGESAILSALSCWYCILKLCPIHETIY